MDDNEKAAYRTPEQLIAEYRRDHGAEIEALVDGFLGYDTKLTLDDYLRNITLYQVLIERHLAAEWARVEEVGK